MPSNNPYGRPKNTPNKRTIALQEFVDEHQGISPARVMLETMWHHYSLAGTEQRQPIPDKAAVAAHLAEASKVAKEVAPYVHSKLTSVVLSGDSEADPIHVHRTGTAIPDDVSALSDDELTQIYRASAQASGLPDEEPG